MSYQYRAAKSAKERNVANIACRAPTAGLPARRYKIILHRPVNPISRIIFLSWMCALATSFASAALPAQLYERSYEDVVNWKIQMRPSTGKQIVPECIAISNLEKTQSSQYAMGFIINQGQSSLLFDIFGHPIPAPLFLRIFIDDRLFGSVEISSVQELTHPSGALFLSKFPDLATTSTLFSLLSGASEAEFTADGSNYSVPLKNFSSVVKEMHQCLLDAASDEQHSHPLPADPAP